MKLQGFFFFKYYLFYTKTKVLNFELKIKNQTKLFNVFKTQ